MFNDVYTRISIDQAVKSFLQDRRAQGLQSRSVEFYECKLKIFRDYCRVEGLDMVMAVQPDHLREMLLELYDTHSPGGVHAVFRTVHAFFYWFENEYEPAGWKNPIRKLHAPKVEIELLDPVSYETVNALIGVCGSTFAGYRDRAILLTLLHTGLRAFELCALDRTDVDLATRTVSVKRGKGGKPRNVYLKRSSKTAIITYLKHRTDKHPALWLTEDGERMVYEALRGMVRYRASQAEIKAPLLHAFRRAFALNCVRAGVDILTLQRLMGHRSLEATKRYVKLTDEDLKSAADSIREEL